MMNLHKMHCMPARPILVSEADIRLLTDFGERLRLARHRRRLTAQAVADAAGITRVTLGRAEAGDAAVTLGTYVKVLAALGLNFDLALLARDDQLGRAMQDQRLPPRRTRSKMPGRARLADLPQLRQIAWQLDDGTEMSPAEALALYERNWRHVDQEAMPAHEKAYLHKLLKTVGKGVLLV